MLPISYKSGFLHFGILIIIVFSLVAVAAVSSFAGSEERDLKRALNRVDKYQKNADHYGKKCRDETRNQSLRDQDCQKEQEFLEKVRLYQAEADANPLNTNTQVSPNEQEQTSTPTIGQDESIIPSSEQDGIIASTSSDTCEVLSPPATLISGLERMGITQVYYVKPLDTVTIKVTGEPNKPYKLWADRWTLTALTSNGEKVRGIPQSDGNGNLTATYRVSKDFIARPKYTGFYNSFPIEALGITLYYLWAGDFTYDYCGGYLAVTKN